MAKNAKSCPAAIGTEELVAYLHTLLQENSHNMQNLWSDESNDATLPVKFQPETKRWKIAKAAMKAGRQVIKTHKDLAKAQRVPQRDVLEKAQQMKMNKYKMLSRAGAADLTIPTRVRDDGERLPDITPVKTRRILDYEDEYEEQTTISGAECRALAEKLRQEYDSGISALTQDEIKEAKVSLDYEDELRASIGQGTMEEDLNSSLLRIYNYMARQMLLTHMTGLLQADYDDFAGAQRSSSWGDKDGHLESTKDRLTQAMQKMIGMNPKIDNLHIYVLKTTRALEVLRWFCSIYKKQRRVDATIREAHAQIALQIEQVFLAHQNITPMLANANEDVKRGVLTKYEFYVNALESMERSLSELASQGKDKTVRLMKRAREESDEESGGGGGQASDEDEESSQPVRKLSLKGKQGSKIAAELQTTTKSQTTKQIFVPGETEADEESASSDSENLTKPRSSAKKPRKGASKSLKSSKAPKSDSQGSEDGTTDISNKKTGTPKKKSSVSKIKKKNQENEEDEEVSDSQLLTDAVSTMVRKVMAEQKAEQKAGGPKTPGASCRMFARGACVYGASCKYSHDGGGAQGPAGADSQRPPRPRGRPQGQHQHPPRNPQPGFYQGAPFPPNFAMPGYHPPGAAPPAGPPPGLLQLPAPAGQQPLQLPYYPPPGAPPNARPQGQVNLLNQGPPVRPGALCDNLMRQGRCNYKGCKGAHGGWTPGAPPCRFETEKKPCPYQANGTCSFMHDVARGN